MNTHTVTGTVYNITIMNNKYDTLKKNKVYEIKSGDDYLNLISYNDSCIDPVHEIEIRYVINPKYSIKNIIESVKHLKTITHEDDIIRFLSKIIKLSKNTSNIIYNKFGPDTINVLINQINKISHPKNLANKNSELLIRKDQYEKLMKYLLNTNSINKKILYTELFDKYNINYTTEYINKIFNQDLTIDFILNQPYQLYTLCKLPMKLVDDLALKISPDNFKSTDRMSTLINFLYKKSEKQGKIYLSKNEIQNFFTDIKICIDGITTDILLLLAKIKNEYYTSQILFNIERKIEKFIVEKSKKYGEAEIITEHNNLDSAQKTAINQIINNSITIINGPPGTGKSYVIVSAIKILKSNSYVLAPTGAAVQNIKQKMQENSVCNNAICCTIHSFIWKISNTTFDCKELNIFIDEMSMVSMRLFWELLDLLDQKVHVEKFRIILIGDKNQLPSICGGNVFEDLINYSDIPQTTLNTQYRAENEILIHNANCALDGSNLEPDNNIITVINDSNANNILTQIKIIVKKYGMTQYNTCVISPTNKHDLGCDNINKILQNYYTGDQPILFNQGNFSVMKNDKLLFKKNEKELNLYNGSILEAISFHKLPNTDSGIDYNNMIHMLKCRYQDTDNDDEKEISSDHFKNIKLGYASTVHSAQGKGFDNVIIVLHRQMYFGLLHRKMLYTAITRTKKKCIILCDAISLGSCKKKDAQRITNLFQN